ncbi:uncharacterized protein LOC123564469 [Mercenaria mercenaria]|uniref:uncharacterized protein LOC123564469 n=1 Tax=Mercenaria mercenaria TaxID=6596 RepID=UPI00234FB382|nr:uncharacterized protein LOC123564469 [Mercenaria mercenaria]
MLKEKMEPTGLAEKFHKMGILNSKSVENVQSGSSREKKNETLIKEICNIKPDSRKDVTYEMFVSYLEETGQGNIVSELRQSMHKRHILGIQHNERHNLMRFFHEMKDVLLDEVEPRIFIDKIVAIGGITIDEHEEITTKSTRRQRIRVLIEKIKSSVSSVSIWIINGMVEAYPGIYTAFKKQKNGNRTTTKEQDDGKQNGLVSIGSSVQMKYQISTGNTLVVEDQNEHDDPMSKMKRMRRQAEEIERRMVDNVNEDLSQLDTLLEHCITGIEEVKFSSIKIHLKALSKHSLDKLVTYSRSSAAKKLFLSLIDDETRQKLLDMKAKIVVEIINGCKDNVATATFENDCLCTLDKERVANNRKALTAGICCSKAVINRFVESHLTDAKTKAFLKKIKPIPKRKERNKKLLQFLLQSDSPVFFCILEEEIIKHGGAEIIRATNRDHLAESEKVKPDTLNKADIQINKDLLFKELEVQWFISHLEKRKDTATQKLLVKIRASESRDERLGPFIEYISKAQDLNWFFEEIKTRHMHLYDTLLSRKTSNNTSSYESVDFKRLEAAVHFFYDEIIEEVDPLVLTKWLGNETKQEVHFSKLRNVHIRSKRASRFCLSLLGVSPKSLHDVLSAMKACGYKEIVDDIIRLAREA